MLARFQRAAPGHIPLLRQGSSARPHPSEGDPARLGQIWLRAQLSDGPQGRCFIASHTGVLTFEPFFFLRIVPRSRDDDALIARYKARAAINQRGAESLYDLREIERQLCIMSGVLDGIGLRRLLRRVRLPWSLSLAVLELALEACASIGTEYLSENLPALSQLFLTTEGQLALGLPKPFLEPEQGDPTVRLISLCLRLSLGPRHPALRFLDGIARREDLVVFTDHLLELSPRTNLHSELLVPYLEGWATDSLSAAQRHELIDANLSEAQLRGFWGTVRALYEEKQREIAEGMERA